MVRRTRPRDVAVAREMRNCDPPSMTGELLLSHRVTKDGVHRMAVRPSREDIEALKLGKTDRRRYVR